MKTNIINEENRINNNEYHEAKNDIDKLVDSFFSLFSVEKGTKADLSGIFDLFIAEGLIVKTCGINPQIYNLQQFIEPREKMFDEGILVDFKEWEVSEKTEVFGNIAHRLSLYKKSGLMNGQEFEGVGIKTSQFIKTSCGWKISSVAWDDEREGFKINYKEN